MSLEDRGAQHDKVTVDKYHDPGADYEMTTRDYVMRPYANGDTGPILLTLPPVAEAKGRFYSILIREADDTNSVTITHRDDSECWVEDVVYYDACAPSLWYSDGLYWHMVGAFRFTWDDLWPKGQP